MCPVYVGSDDVAATARQTGVAEKSITPCNEGDVLFNCIKVVHTPGHTPGSVCFQVGEEYLISGDTLFIGSCGRVDLAESNPEAMDASLYRLSKFPDRLKVLPGHNYAAPPTSTIGKERASNFMMRQAMSNLRPEPTSATLSSCLLPDYVGAARRALLEERGKF